MRGCPGSISGWVTLKKKSIHLVYVLYMVFILYAYYISFILHIYVESKVCVIYKGLHLQHILGDPRDRWCYEWHRLDARYEGALVQYQAGSFEKRKKDTSYICIISDM